mgnify:CR=1 FL=1
MNKQELITKIAEKSNLSKKDATAALTALIDTITETLKAEGKLTIPSLGTFEVKQHAARTGHNPRTGETVEIAAKKVPAFKALRFRQGGVQADLPGQRDYLRCKEVAVKLAIKGEDDTERDTAYVCMVRIGLSWKVLQINSSSLKD